MSNEPQNDWSSPEEWAAHFSALYPDEASVFRRIPAKVRPNPANDHWPRKGSDNLWIGENKWLSIRRVVYAATYRAELDYGPVPRTHEVRVNCDDPTCINPRHLRLAPKKKERIAAERGQAEQSNATLQNFLAQWKRTDDIWEGIHCLRWQGYHWPKDTDLKPDAQLAGKHYDAVRLKWELDHDLEPGELSCDVFLIPKCKYHDCAEPTHLEEVTRAEHRRRRNPDPEERFRAQLVIDSELGCDLCSEAKGGLYIICIDNEKMTGRQYAWWKRHNEKVPKGSRVVALCNRQDGEYCVNPDHLTVETWAESARRFGKITQVAT